MELADLLLDDLFPLARLLVALGHVGLNDLLQVVHREEVGALQVVHPGIDVARHGDVDEEHRLELAPLHHRLHIPGADDGVGRAGGGEHDICPVELLEQLLKKHPGNPDLLYDSALVADRLDKVELVEERLRQVIAQQPDNAHAYNALGYTFAERNLRLEEARELVARALALSPGDAFIIDSMGWVLYRQGDLSGALSQLQKAYAIRQDPEIAAHLGEVLWVLGRQDEARRVLREAVRLNPDNEALAAAAKKFLP